MGQKVIAVFGSSRREETSLFYQEAYELGQVLAHAGYTVLSGGYHGSMGAVSRGAHEAGGRVIGVTCAIFDPLPPNRWLTQEIKAPTMLSRLETMLTQADGFVAVRGGIGTLSEVTLAWSLMQVHALTRKPLVLLGAGWQALIDTFYANTDLSGSIASIARIVATVTEVPAALIAPPGPSGPPPLG